jgi:hypothetical protein
MTDPLPPMRGGVSAINQIKAYQGAKETMRQGPIDPTDTRNLPVSKALNQKPVVPGTSEIQKNPPPIEGLGTILDITVSVAGISLLEQFLTNIQPFAERAQEMGATLYAYGIPYENLVQSLDYLKSFY